MINAKQETLRSEIAEAFEDEPPAATPIVPGETFVVAYGSGKRAEVMAFNLVEKRRLGDMMVQMQMPAKGCNPFDLVIKALQMVLPGEMDSGEVDQYIIENNLDDSTAMDIVQGCAQGNAVSAEVKKKSE